MPAEQDRTNTHVPLPPADDTISEPYGAAKATTGDRGPSDDGAACAQGISEHTEEEGKGKMPIR